MFLQTALKKTATEARCFRPSQAIIASPVSCKLSRAENTVAPGNRKNTAVNLSDVTLPASGCRYKIKLGNVSSVQILQSKTEQAKKSNFLKIKIEKGY